MGDGDKDVKTIELEIDGEKKVFTPEAVLDMHKNLATATQNSQKAAALLKLAEQTGMSPEELSGQVSGVFGLVQDLVDQGIIDADGNVIQKKAAKPDDDDNAGRKLADNKSTFDESKIVELVKSAMAQELDPFKKAIKDLGEMNVGTQRHIIATRLKDEFRDHELSDQDVTNIMASARAGKLTIRDAAQGYLKTRAEQVTAIEQKFMQKHGIDPKQFDLNKLKEQDSEGAAATIIGEKKLSFKKKDGGITPVAAARDYLNQRL